MDEKPQQPSGTQDGPPPANEWPVAEEAAHAAEAAARSAAPAPPTGAPLAAAVAAAAPDAYRHVQSPSDADMVAPAVAPAAAAARPPPPARIRGRAGGTASRGRRPAGGKRGVDGAGSADDESPASARGPGHEEGADALSSEVFTQYVPRSVQAFPALAAAVDHPADVVEAASLSAVALPAVDAAVAAELADALGDCIADESLSSLQIEGVLLASARHAQDLPDGTRAGFFLGDSAGVGKGRQIAACILANHVAGRTRSLWVSTSRDLVADARRDMSALGALATAPFFGGGRAAHTVPVYAGPDEAAKAGALAGGVLFMTYTTLARKGRVGQKRGSAAAAAESRLDQAVAWLAKASGGNPENFDGVIVFDESHKAKTFKGGGDGESVQEGFDDETDDDDVVLSAGRGRGRRGRGPGRGRGAARAAGGALQGGKGTSATCQMALNIQHLLPRARVICASATGVSDVSNLAYQQRSGLWGPSTPFASFRDFQKSLSAHGVGFLELLAMEMKKEGTYIARSLSYRNAEFEDLACPMTAEAVAAYDVSTSLWERAKALAGSTGTFDSKLFYGSQMRFYRCLLSALKVPAILAAAREALANGMCVVIGMQSTGEAGLRESGRAVGDRLDALPSSAKDMLLGWLERHVKPSSGERAAARGAAAGRGRGRWESEDDDSVVALSDSDGGGGGGGGSDSGDGAPPDPYAVLVADILAADLPPNPLDALIDGLGGPDRVAEMTGRTLRVVRDDGGGGGGGRATGSRRGSATSRAAAAAAVVRPFVVESRVSAGARSRVRAALTDDAGTGSTNVLEARAFQGGSKLVALLSDAASTGISLHASRDVANQRRRCHITLELAWSADKSVQQLGRSHRSNAAADAPLYKLAQTPLGGEARFAATLSRRMQGLGALTRGDRRAAGGGAEDDLGGTGLVDSPYGAAAVRAMRDAVDIRASAVAGGRAPPAVDSAALPEGVTLAAIAAAADSSLRHLPASVAGDPDLAPLAVGREMAAREADAERRREGGDGGGGDGAPAVAAAAAAAAPGGPSAADLVGAIVAVHNTLRADLASMGLGAVQGSALVTRLLNRTLALPVARQVLVSSYFTAALAAKVADAKEAGTFDAGVATVAGALTRVGADQVLWSSATAGPAVTAWYRELEVDRGISYDDAAARLAAHVPVGPGDMSGFWRAKHAVGGPTRGVLLALALRPPVDGAPPTEYAIIRPGTGVSRVDMSVDQLTKAYAGLASAPGTDELARAEWTGLHNTALHTCRHGPACRRGLVCTDGMRRSTLAVVHGSIVRVWGVLSAILERHKERLSPENRTLRALRVPLEGEDGGGRHEIIGVRFPVSLIATAQRELREVEARGAAELAARAAARDAARAEAAAAAAAGGGGGGGAGEDARPAKRPAAAAPSPPSTPARCFAVAGVDADPARQAAVRRLGVGAPVLLVREAVGGGGGGRVRVEAPPGTVLGFLPADGENAAPAATAAALVPGNTARGVVRAVGGTPSAPSVRMLPGGQACGVLVEVLESGGGGGGGGGGPGGLAAAVKAESAAPPARPPPPAAVKAEPAAAARPPLAVKAEPAAAARPPLAVKAEPAPATTRPAMAARAADPEAGGAPLAKLTRPAGAFVITRHVNELVAMGFDRDLTIAALDRALGVPERAAELLVAHQQAAMHAAFGGGGGGGGGGAGAGAAAAALPSTITISDDDDNDDDEDVEGDEPIIVMDSA